MQDGRFEGSRPVYDGWFAHRDRTESGRDDVVARVEPRRRLIWPMLAPALLLFVLFFVYPIFETLRLSLTDWDGVAPASFIGLENYKDLWSDRLFRQSLWNITKLALIGLVMVFPTAISLAWALRQDIRGERLFQYIVFMPAILSVAMAAILWLYIYHPTIGLINPALTSVGLESVTRPWLGDPDTVIIAIVIAATWHGMGIWVILIGAGIDGIPTTLLEAARLDGASEIQILRKVIIPLIWDLLRVLIVYYIINALKAFALVWIMTQGGPFGSSEIPGTFIYRVAFERSNFGYAAALGVALSIIVLVVVVVSNRVLGGRQYVD